MKRATAIATIASLAALAVLGPGLGSDAWATESAPDDAAPETPPVDSSPPTEVDDGSRGEPDEEAD